MEFFSKRARKGNSKDLHHRSRHSLLSESEKTLVVSVYKTYFIAEVNGDRRCKEYDRNSTQWSLYCFIILFTQESYRRCKEYDRNSTQWSLYCL